MASANAGFLSHNTPSRERSGSTARSSSRRLRLSSGESVVRPVTSPPGRLRLFANPVRTGSPAMTRTIGVVGAASCAASPAGVPAVTITSTLARVSSPTNPRKSAVRLAPHRKSMAIFRPSTCPLSRRACRKMSQSASRYGAGEPMSRTPIRETFPTGWASLPCGTGRRVASEVSRKRRRSMAGR
jgi:hypothetical protein